jgi:hypothetical protein
MALNIQEIGLMAKLLGKVLKLCLIKLLMMDFGKMEISLKVNVYIQIRKYTMANGQMGNLVVKVLRLGLMERNMKDYGNLGNLSELAEKYILLEKLN